MKRASENCPESHIYYAGSCCMDKNRNNVCDSYEKNCKGEAGDYCVGNLRHFDAECLNGNWSYALERCQYECRGGVCVENSTPHKNNLPQIGNESAPLEYFEEKTPEQNYSSEEEPQGLPEKVCTGTGVDYCSEDTLKYGAVCVEGVWEYRSKECLFGCEGGKCSAPGCPDSCEDGNPCTEDYCSEDTDYVCEYRKLEGEHEGCEGSNSEKCESYSCYSGECIATQLEVCCGDGKCESDEDYLNCEKDCGGVECGEEYEIKCGHGGPCDSDEDCAALNCVGGVCKKTSGKPLQFTDFEFYGPESLDNLEIYITWHERPEENVGIYAAFTFHFEAGQGGYMGIQRDGSLEKDRVLFSIWSINDDEESSECVSTEIPEEDLINCGKLMHAQSGEGNFGQALGQYAWVPGREYRLKIERDGRDEGGDFWRGTITDMVSEDKLEIGTIHLDDSNGYEGYGNLTRFSGVFLEYYYGHSGYCDENNVYSKVEWRGPYTDENLADRAYIYYPMECMYAKRYSPQKGIIIHEGGGPIAWENEGTEFWN